MHFSRVKVDLFSNVEGKHMLIAPFMWDLQ